MLETNTRSVINIDLVVKVISSLVDNSSCSFLSIFRESLDSSTSLFLILNHEYKFITLCGQVFDGHGGTDAASFIRQNILKFIIEDSHFPLCMPKAIKSAFVKADNAFADASSLDISSGTTALTAVIFEKLVSFKSAFEFDILLQCEVSSCKHFHKKNFLALFRFCPQDRAYLHIYFGFS